MRILVQGTRPEDVEYQGKCSHCNTQVVFKRSEAKEVTLLSRHIAALEVDCPVCDKKIRSLFTKYVPPASYECW